MLKNTEKGTKIFNLRDTKMDTISNCTETKWRKLLPIIFRIRIWFAHVRRKTIWKEQERKQGKMIDE